MRVFPVAAGKSCKSRYVGVSDEGTADRPGSPFVGGRTTKASRGCRKNFGTPGTTPIFKVCSHLFFSVSRRPDAKFAKAPSAYSRTLQKQNCRFGDASWLFNFAGIALPTFRVHVFHVVRLWSLNKLFLKAWSSSIEKNLGTGWVSARSQDSEVSASEPKLS